MAWAAKRRPAYGYMRTSSSTNIGADKDSERRQRHAIESYAKTHGYDLVVYYDAAVRALIQEPTALAAITGDGVRAILIETIVSTRVVLHRSLMPLDTFLSLMARRRRALTVSTFLSLRSLPKFFVIFFNTQLSIVARRVSERVGQTIMRGARRRRFQKRQAMHVATRGNRVRDGREPK